MLQWFLACTSTLTREELVYVRVGTRLVERVCFCCIKDTVWVQGGAEWALARRDQLALGLSEIPQAARQRETTPAGRARAALALTTLPKHLPCRDAERAQINQFLKDVLCPGEHYAGIKERQLRMFGVLATLYQFPCRKSKMRAIGQR